MSATPRSTLALAIPEIVTYIGRFLSLWTLNNGELSFSPGTLLRLSRVSKIWYLAFVPIVWSGYSLDVMGNVPGDVLQRNTIYARRFCSFKCISQSMINESWFPRLQHIVMYDVHQPLELFLPRATTVTRLELYFISPETNTHLDRAMEMVGSFSSTVTRLSLHGLYCDTYQQLHDILSSFPRLSSFCFTTSETDIQSTAQQAVSIVPLPIRDLEIKHGLRLRQSFLFDAFFENFIKCCPGLETVVITTQDVYDDDVQKSLSHPRMNEIVACVRKFCPRIRSFSVQGKNKNLRIISMNFNAIFALSGQHRGKVVQFRAFLCVLSDRLMSWTMHHGKAIQVLDLENLGLGENSRRSAEWLAKLLSSKDLVSLRELRFTRLHKFSYEHSELVFTSKWSAHRLEKLSLNGLSLTGNSDEKSDALPSESGGAIQWRPRNGMLGFNKGFNKLIQRRLRELPALKILAFDGVTFNKVHA